MAVASTPKATNIVGSRSKAVKTRNAMSDAKSTAISPTINGLEILVSDTRLTALHRRFRSQLVDPRCRSIGEEYHQNVTSDDWCHCPGAVEIVGPDQIAQHECQWHETEEGPADQGVGLQCSVEVDTQ